MNKRIVILGSSGSIGTQTLDVVDESNNSITVSGLSVYSNITLLLEQVKKYKPLAVCIVNEDKALEFHNIIKNENINIEVLSGAKGLIELAKLSEYDVLVNSVVGIAGLIPTITAIKNKKDIALANKETLVTAGQLINDLVKEYGVKMLPVDSEHSAIFQCLQGNAHNKISKLYLTASGGSFRDKTYDELKNVTVKEALNHPNWSMGKKITIDSATLMNKGLEVIEAKWLFDVEPSQIDVLIHRQSIIHSMVEFEDKSIIAQLGEADMRLPIQYALNYPNRLPNNTTALNPIGLNLTFEKPNTELFPCLQYAYDSLYIGGNMSTIYNSSNEECVQLFLDDKIKFLDIQKLIYNAMDSYVDKVDKSYSIDSIETADKYARNYVLNNYKKI